MKPVKEIGPPSIFNPPTTAITHDGRLVSKLSLVVRVTHDGCYTFFAFEANADRFIASGCDMTLGWRSLGTPATAPMGAFAEGFYKARREVKRKDEKLEPLAWSMGIKNQLSPLHKNHTLLDFPDYQVGNITPYCACVIYGTVGNVKYAYFMLESNAKWFIDNGCDPSKTPYGAGSTAAPKPTEYPLFKSDGSTAAYYEPPEGATQLQDLISAKNMNAQIGEITRACYHYSQASHSDQLRDAKKILFYAQAEVDRLEKYGA